MQSGDFSELLSRAEKLKSSIQHSEEPTTLPIPLVERNLNQVYNANPVTLLNFTVTFAGIRGR